MKRGFTLIELIIYIALVSIFIGGAVNIALDTIYGSVKSTAQQEVAANLRFATKRILYEIRNANSIVDIGANNLCLATLETTHNPTRIHVENGRLRIGWGGNLSNCGPPAPEHTQYLTSNLVTVTDLTFTNLSAADTQNVQFTITISHNNPSGRKEWQATATTTTSAEIRSIQ